MTDQVPSESILMGRYIYPLGFVNPGYGYTRGNAGYEYSSRFFPIITPKACEILGDCYVD